MILLGKNIIFLREEGYYRIESIFHKYMENKILSVSKIKRQYKKYLFKKKVKLFLKKWKRIKKGM